MKLGDVARMESMNKGHWQTSDLRLGAYLRLQGMKIVCLKKAGGRVIFEFEERPDRKDLITQFYNREAAVEPLAYMASIGEMRDMVTMAERSNGGVVIGKNGGNGNGG